MEFDKIVNKNFKKKAKVSDIPDVCPGNAFLGVGPVRQREKSASKSR